MAYVVPRVMFCGVVKFHQTKVGVEIPAVVITEFASVYVLVPAFGVNPETYCHIAIRIGGVPDELLTHIPNCVMVIVFSAVKTSITY